MRYLSLCLLLAGLSGCFRLSDPFYLPRDLSADERHGPEYSLLFGSVEVEGGLFGPDGIDSIIFRRLQPGGEPDYWYVGELHLFRAFQGRHMRAGHFVISLPPGAYELEGLQNASFFGPSRFTMSEAVQQSSRFYITRPGLYDLGTLRISSPRGLLGPYVISRVESEDDAKLREALIRQVVQGTPWEPFLEELKKNDSKSDKDVLFTQRAP